MSPNTAPTSTPDKLAPNPPMSPQRRAMLKTTAGAPATLGLVSTPNISRTEIQQRIFQSLLGVTKLALEVKPNSDFAASLNTKGIFAATDTDGTIIPDKDGNLVFDRKNPDYWYCLADFIRQQIENRRTKPNADELSLSTIELFASFPRFLLADKILQHPNVSVQDQRFLKLATIKFNSDLRKMAQNFHNVWPADLVHGLRDAALGGFQVEENELLRKERGINLKSGAPYTAYDIISNILWSRMSGAKAELGAIELFNELKLTFQESSGDVDDLLSKVRYLPDKIKNWPTGDRDKWRGITDLSGGDIIFQGYCYDIKSSPQAAADAAQNLRATAVIIPGSAQPLAYLRSNGNAIIAPTTLKDFDDTFHLRQDLIPLRAGILNLLLFAIDQQRQLLSP